MNHDLLSRDLEATHVDLRERLDRAHSACTTPDRRQPRAARPAIDQFLRSASRHNAAVLRVMVPATRARPGVGRGEARDLVTQCRRLEVALNQVKAKEYGSIYAVRIPWDLIWSQVRREFELLCRLELPAARHLDTGAPTPTPDWPTQMHRAELSAPSRPHPWIPHQGLPGRTARAVARRVDAFWDASETRMLPSPPDHRDRAHEGHLTQYLLADPHLHDGEDLP